MCALDPVGALIAAEKLVQPLYVCNVVLDVQLALTIRYFHSKRVDQAMAYVLRGSTADSTQLLARIDVVASAVRMNVLLVPVHHCVYFCILISCCCSVQVRLACHRATSGLGCLHVFGSSRGRCLGQWRSQPSADAPPWLLQLSISIQTGLVRMRWARLSMGLKTASFLT